LPRFARQTHFVPHRPLSRSLHSRDSRTVHTCGEQFASRRTLR
jgi:hypothetical protein